MPSYWKFEMDAFVKKVFFVPRDFVKKCFCTNL